VRTLLAPFVLVFTALLVSIGSYIGLRLASSPLDWAGIVMIGILLLLFPLVHWKSRLEGAKEPSSLRTLLQVAGFLSMGLMSWLLVVAVARDILLLVLWLLKGAETVSAFSAQTKGFPALLAAFLLTVLGAFRALRGLRVKNVLVKIPGLPESLRGLRIAQISDLHIGPTIRRAYVQGVVNRISTLAPDLTVLTGDIVDGHVGELEAHAAPLALLEPRGRVFFSPGNHDYYSGLTEWKPELEKLGLQVLLNRGELVKLSGRADIWVGGVTDPVAGQKPDAASAMKGGEKADFRLLLSHRPELAEAAEKAGFQLQLSGHTHGGQFFPWTLVAKRFHEFYQGLMKQKEMWIYVSPGTGSWGPPIRLGTTPEISLIELSS
jgi:predicted MPP superfamily phosphohydrolase